MSEKLKIRTSKKGIIMKSPYSGKSYTVYKWKDYGDGRVVALQKEEVKENE